MNIPASVLFSELFASRVYSFADNDPLVKATIVPEAALEFASEFNSKDESCKKSKTGRRNFNNATLDPAGILPTITITTTARN